MRVKQVCSVFTIHTRYLIPVIKTTTATILPVLLTKSTVHNSNRREHNEARDKVHMASQSSAQRPGAAASQFQRFL